MSEKRYLFEKRYYVSCLLYLCDKDLSNTLSIFECADLLNQLTEENEELKEINEKLQWELDKTREDLNYFANLKAGAMRGSDCGHNRCYVTSMQKRDDEDDN